MSEPRRNLAAAAGKRRMILTAVLIVGLTLSLLTFHWDRDPIFPLGVTGFVLFLLYAFLNAPPRYRRHGAEQIREAVDHNFGNFTGSYPDEIETVWRGRRIGRNEACPCGSGSKYKHCCGR